MYNLETTARTKILVDNLIISLIDNSDSRLENYNLARGQFRNGLKEISFKGLLGLARDLKRHICVNHYDNRTYNGTFINTIDSIRRLDNYVSRKVITGDGAINLANQASKNLTELWTKQNPSVRLDTRSL